MGALKVRAGCETLTPFESASDRTATPRMWRRRAGAAHPRFKSRGVTNMREQYQHVFVHARPLRGGGYNIACEKCGEVYGSSESADPNFLAGFNRNKRVLARRTASSPRRSRAADRPR